MTCCKDVARLLEETVIVQHRTIGIRFGLLGAGIICLASVLTLLDVDRSPASALRGFALNVFLIGSPFVCWALWRGSSKSAKEYLRISWVITAIAVAIGSYRALMAWSALRASGGTPADALWPTAIYSFVLTTLLTVGLEWLFCRLGERRGRESIEPKSGG